MRILVVASFNHGSFAPFVVEQAAALRAAGCEVRLFGLQGKGFQGYLKNLPALKSDIKAFRPDVVHAHYGLSGLFANLQRQAPVVTTYHGSDINDKDVLRFSTMAMNLSAWNVFVSKKTLDIAQPKKRFSLLPCGVDFNELQLTLRDEARQKMNLYEGKKYILFAGAFDNGVKNAPLAYQTVTELKSNGVELLELKGYTRDEVTLLMCAADAFLMTSLTEGSPQVVKEAMACGCPIVSVDVGDVKERTDGVEGCFVAKSREPQELAGLLRKAMRFEGKTKGREKIIAEGLDNRQVAQKLIDVYKEVCHRN